MTLLIPFRTAANGKAYVPNALNQYEAVGADNTSNAGLSNGSEHEIESYKGVIYKYYGDTYLSSVNGGGNTYQLYYDALGRCVERKLNGVPLYYLYDGEHWIAEYDGIGAVKSTVVYGRGIDEVLLHNNTSGGPHWPLPDRNGNTAFVMGKRNAANNFAFVLEWYRYDAFGAPKIYDAANNAIGASAIGNRFLFTGREYDSLFGFYEYRARAYHPGLGRFMSEDPKGFDAGDYNFYRYCDNDPLDRTDPMGLYGIDDRIPPTERAKIERIQKASAGVANRAANAIANALAGKKGSRDTISAFQKRFGALNATPNKMRDIADKLRESATALGDDGRKGYWLRPEHLGKQTTVVAEGAIGGKTIWLNLDHSSSNNSSVLTNAIPHESLHNAGLHDIEDGHGLKAYSDSGNQKERDFFDSLPVSRPADALRSVDTVRAFENSPQ